MSDKKISLSRRKVLGGLTALGAAGAASGAGTFALFSDTEQSSENQVQAGTLDLTQSSTVTAATNLAPGESTTGSVTLTNGGTLTADHLEIGVTEINSTDENDGSGNGASSKPDGSGADKSAMEVANHIYVDRLSYGSDYTYNDSSASWWQDEMPTVQLPGVAIVESTNSNSSLDVSPTNSNGVTVTSGTGGSDDYFHTMVDVSGEGTLTNVGSFSYDATKNSGDVDVPDETKVIAEHQGETLYFWAPDSTSESGNTYTFDLTQDVWELINTKTGEPDGSSHAPANEYPNADIKLVGVACGDIANDPSSNEDFDVTFDNLSINGTTYTLPTTPPTVGDLQDNAYVVDDMMAPGGDEDFEFTLRLDPDVGNDFQGDGVNVTFDFGLAQESGQDIL